MNPSQVPLPDPIIDDAISWLIRLEINNSTADTRTEFEQWLQQSSQHQLAWARVREIRGSFSSLPSKPIASALNTLDKQSSDTRLSRRQVLKALSVTGFMLGNAWLTKEYTPWQRLLADFSTVTGEQNSFILADGSQVMLNTDTAISTDLAGHTRKLTLRRGEIMLTTDADLDQLPERPFMIKTPAGRIQTQDSRFTVRLDHHRTHVSVQKGQLELLNRRGIKQRVGSGDSFLLSDKGIYPTAPSAISPDAWTSGAISGKHIPLGELLDELSRYRTGIIDYSPELKDLLVSGIFQLRDTDSTLNFLARVQPIRVDFRTPYWVLIRPA